VTSEGLLTTYDVARMLQLSPREVRDKAQQKEIPAFKVGGEWRFDRAEIERWLEAQRNTPEPPKT
jgi:excisionase family DNA binding protein